MIIRYLPHTDKSIDTGYLSRFGIQAYDKDNLYPQNILRLVAQSKNATGCLERYRDYVEGDGISSLPIATLKANPNGETWDDLHELLSNDYATFNGIAIHVNYNVYGQIVNARAIPFENVRLEEPDEEGVVKRVAIHPDWSGESTRNGKRVTPRKENIDFVDVFNPEPTIVQAQIREAGGIQFYKGQVLYISAAGHLRYPLAKFDSVLTDISTDEGLSNIMLRNARNNFLPAGIFVHYRGQQNPTGLGSEYEYENDEDEGYSDELRSLQGDMSACKIMDITVDSKDDIPEFIKFDVQNYDKDFSVTTQTVEDNIYSRFGQEAFLSLRRGKVGFSGNLIKDATDDYARRCAKAQRVLSRAYSAVLQHWDPSLLPAGADVQNIQITPITYAISTNE